MSADAFLEMLTGNWKTQALLAAAELGIADAIGERTRSASELASVLNLDEGALHRLLRALATLDVLREADGGFSLGPTGRFLLRDGSECLQAWVQWWAGVNGPVWAKLSHSIRAGQSVRTGFESLESDPERASLLHRAMSELTRHSARAVAERIDLAGVQVVADVGGGSGELLAAVLDRHELVKGIVFDLPHAHAASRELHPRARFVAGDFFVGVPPADAYLLKSILHDWPDEKAGQILRTIRSAVSASGRLFIVERILPEVFEATPEHQEAARMDLHMLLAHGAKERTKAEFERLLCEPGFELNKIEAVTMGLSLIEARPLA